MADEQHPYFPSGDWEGHYLQYGNKGPMAMSLDFAEGKVSGVGADPVGPYVWSGTYDTTSLVVKMAKQYLGGHRVDYDGRADESGIFGGWTIGSFASGGFHIWPKSKGQEEQEEEEVEKKEKVLTITA